MWKLYNVWNDSSKSSLLWAAREGKHENHKKSWKFMKNREMRVVASLGVTYRNNRSAIISACRENTPKVPKLSPKWGEHGAEIHENSMLKRDWKTHRKNNEKNDIGKVVENLEKLQKKFGFNLNFEGGEAETFVINCPLFEKPLFIQDSSTEWDGYRGRFEILEAKLKDNAW